MPLAGGGRTRYLLPKNATPALAFSGLELRSFGPRLSLPERCERSESGEISVHRLRSLFLCNSCLQLRSSSSKLPLHRVCSRPAHAHLIFGPALLHWRIVGSPCLCVLVLDTKVMVLDEIVLGYVLVISIEPLTASLPFREPSASSAPALPLTRFSGSLRSIFRSAHIICLLYACRSRMVEQTTIP